MEMGMGQLKKPDFIIIGAQKCGTTTLFQHLRKHPDTRLPKKKKELHFFDTHYAAGLDWYLNHFNREGKPEVPFCTGEASPYYFFHPLVPARIYSAFPGIKLILLLRNPANRSYSQYHHMKRYHRISLSFEHCIKLESEIIKGRKEAFFTEEYHSDMMYRRFSFLARSRYAEQLASWYDFFPKEQILIIRSEDYFANPETTFRIIFQFLDLQPYAITLTKKHEPSDYPPMKEETRKYLMEYFEPFNQDLYKLTERDFGWFT
jgi:hypothetical protein